jgi:hypothetical protein
MTSAFNRQADIELQISNIGFWHLADISGCAPRGKKAAGRGCDRRLTEGFRSAPGSAEGACGQPPLPWQKYRTPKCE